MAAPLLSLKNVSLRLGRQALLADVELVVGEGDRLALVGRNGSGKSTLLKIMAGEVEPDQGEVVRQGTTVRYLPQEPDLSDYATTLAYVEAGLVPGDDHHRGRILLAALGLTGDEEPSRLSGGEKRRAALARVLAPQPDILILDEPTNHLDLPAIEWLEAELVSSRSAIVLVSHDRRHAGDVVARDAVARPREGSTPRPWLRRPSRDGATRRSSRRSGTARSSTERLPPSCDWLRYGVTARRSRNQGRLRALNEMRRARREAASRHRQGEVLRQRREDVGQAGDRGRRTSRSRFGERVLIRDLSIRIARGDRLGIVGPNGAGKTTLVEILTGAATPDSGTVRLGTNLEIASLDQRRASLDPATTLKQALTRTGGDTVMVGGQSRHVMSYMRDFLFSPEQAGQPVSALSGGERGRLMLARALATPSNLLVLDEPTNDLDLETLDLLQEAIADYPGTVILVSHDRDFLDRTVTSVLAAEGTGRWIEYAGGYTDMLAQRGEREGESAEVTAPITRKVSQPPASAPAIGRTKRKLSFKEKHALANASRAHRRACLRGGPASQNARRPGTVLARSGTLSANGSRP